MLELGTALGNLTANLCRLLPLASIVTVDAPAGMQSGRLTTHPLRADEIGQVYRRHGFESRVTQVFADTRNLHLSDLLHGRRIDLAVIDACHDYDFVARDFRLVVRFMSEWGVVFFHDLHPSLAGHLLDSYAAGLWLRRRGFDVRHLDGTWWGMWTRDWSRWSELVC